MYFISEVSSNHSKDLERCIEFIKVSAEIGCDAVKFQLFEVEKLFSHEVFKANPSVLDRKHWKYRENFGPIREACNHYNIQLGCTPFDIGAVEFLNDYVDFFKIIHELLWTDLIVECAKTDKDLLFQQACLIYKKLKTQKMFWIIFHLKSILFYIVFQRILLSYEANLSAMETLKNELNCKLDGLIIQ